MSFLIIKPSARGATAVEYAVALGCLVVVLAVVGEMILTAIQVNQQQRATSLDVTGRQPLITQAPQSTASLGP